MMKLNLRVAQWACLWAFRFGIMDAGGDPERWFK